MEFYPSSVQAGGSMAAPVVTMQNSCGECKPKYNVISTETIAFHTVTNVFLWSLAALLIGSTPNDPYSPNINLGNNQDGQNQGMKKQTRCCDYFLFDTLYLFFFVYSIPLYLNSQARARFPRGCTHLLQRLD